MPSDYTAKELLDGKYTLNQVDDMVHDGRISVDVANEYFKVWVVGKLEHRWNEKLNRPEELIYNIYSTPEAWREMRWG